VTVEQYAAFLNAKATRADGANASVVTSLHYYGMYYDLNVAQIRRNGSGTAESPYAYTVKSEEAKKPVTFVTWFNAARFANWLHNGGMADSDMEDGAYTLNGALYGTFPRNSGAKYWIPSDAEWFKSAYYKGGSLNNGYWMFPTQSDVLPGNSSATAANQANWRKDDKYFATQSSTLESTVVYLSDVGTFTNSPSAYGTFDQGGNVDEWTDTVMSSQFGDEKITRGGSWISGGLNADVSPVATALPTDRNSKLGFRLARPALPVTETPTTPPAPAFSGRFVVTIAGASGAPKTIEPGEVMLFSVRKGGFTVDAVDAVDANLSASASFSTQNKSWVRIVIDTTGGTININLAEPDADF
jgi:formylglycine-generating enzyme required for sulfatase activity